jgi:hypothetical protein
VIVVMMLGMTVAILVIMALFTGVRGICFLGSSAEMCGYRRRILAPFLRFTRSLRHSTVTHSAALRKYISSPDRAGVSYGVSRPLSLLTYLAGEAVQRR